MHRPQIWDLRTCHSVRVLKGHTSHVTCCQSDSNMIVRCVGCCKCREHILYLLTHFYWYFTVGDWMGLCAIGTGRDNSRPLFLLVPEVVHFLLLSFDLHPTNFFSVVRDLKWDHTKMVVATGCEEGIHIYNTMMTKRYSSPGPHHALTQVALKPVSWPWADGANCWVPMRTRGW
jgi:hypothetical protein